MTKYCSSGFDVRQLPYVWPWTTVVGPELEGTDSMNYKGDLEQTQLHSIYRVDHKVGQFFFFKESNFQIVRVFCATKIFFLIFDTFKKKKN
jgi:hypothetical protein